jgi:glycosyltransferase involved in cell wall biosynthesis
MAAEPPPGGPGRRLVIAIPAYNAAETLESVFARMPPEITRRSPHYVVVDDGSTDDTATVARRLQSRFPALDLVRHEPNRGYGGAAKTGLARALALGADLVAWVHGDGQYAPESLPALLAPLEADRADIVQGSRFRGGGARRGGMPVYKIVANRVLTWMENRVFGLGLAEYHSGYMLYRRRALELIPFQRFTTRGFVFDQEVLATARVLGLRVVDLPIPTRYAGERSHLRVIPYGLAVLGLMGRYLRGDYHRLVARAKSEKAPADSGVGPPSRPPLA